METIFYCPFDGADEATEWSEEIQDLTPSDSVLDSVVLDTSQKVSGSASLFFPGSIGEPRILSYEGIQWISPSRFSTTIYVRPGSWSDSDVISIGLSVIVDEQSTNINAVITSSEIILYANDANDTYAGSIPVNEFSKIDIIVDGLDVTLKFGDSEICSRELAGEISAVELAGIGVVTASAGGVWFDEWTIESNVLMSDIITEASLALDAQAPSYAISSDVPEATVTLNARAPSSFWSVQPNRLATAQVIYRCVLTGDGDDTTDITLPMKSFQARLRDGDPSYLSCVIPDSITYAPLVVERTNGEIIIYSGYRLDDGTEQVEEIIRANYESLQIDRGSNNDSLTISGHKTITSSSPKDWTVAGVSFYGQTAAGKRRIRANLDPFIRCGDTCIYGTGGNDYFVIGRITCWVTANPAGYFMEVIEA